MTDRWEFEETDKKYREFREKTDLEIATFAGGCFWCLDTPFRNAKGVREVFAGYAGGEKELPTYEDVIRGHTGHRESVQVFYDPEEISYEELLDIFWLQIDPTDPGGQFADRGPQYMTAIFYHDYEQEELAWESMEALEDSNRYQDEIVTEILPFTTFYPAEDYHQSYPLKAPKHYEQYATLSGRKQYIESIKKRIEAEG